MFLLVLSSDYTKLWFRMCMTVHLHPLWVRREKREEMKKIPDIWTKADISSREGDKSSCPEVSFIHFLVRVVEILHTPLSFQPLTPRAGTAVLGVSLMSDNHLNVRPRCLSTRAASAVTHTRLCRQINFCTLLFLSPLLLQVTLQACIDPPTRWGDKGQGCSRASCLQLHSHEPTPARPLTQHLIAN